MDIYLILELNNKHNFKCLYNIENIKVKVLKIKNMINIFKNE